MEFVADLHVHSRYSRATSKDATPEAYGRWAARKGVTLVGTGDFTHPAWREELREKLEPAEEGLYRLKEEWWRRTEAWGEAGLGGEYSPCGEPAPHLVEPDGRPRVRFVVSGEISTIYKKGGRVRKVHHLILLPGLEAAEAVSRRLERVGNLQADGRPILGLDSRDLLALVLEVCPEALLIPAHIWTPHFSLLGANSGFDHPAECFEDLVAHVGAVETGLSSNPPMNWRFRALDRFVLVSNSDAHSPRNLAREANLFATELSYPGVCRALWEGANGGFRGTLEFFPEEGKYHYDGHRACGVRWPPAETRAAGGICPACGRKVTVGVLHRVEALADREEGVRPPGACSFESLVPLPELVAAALGVGPASRRVGEVYFRLLHLGPELFVLREAPLEAVERLAGPVVAEALRRMRAGALELLPGFDGAYGTIVVLRPEERQRLEGQVSLFILREEGGDPPLAQAPAADAATRAAGEAGGLADGAAGLGGGTAGAVTGWAGTEAMAARLEEGRPGATRDGAPSRQDGASPSDAAAARYLAGLNREQREAVTAAAGPVIVIAGPGTGKTRTLVQRIAYLIGARGVAPAEITAVTFTNKAAEEIRGRLGEILGDLAGSAGPVVGTFHSLCLDLLRAVAATAAAPPALRNGFTVLDEGDARRVLAEVLRETGRPAGEAERLLRRLSFYKSQGSGPHSPQVPAALRPLYAAYQERLTAYRALDYDDLLLQAAALPDGLFFSPGRHLLVDEFQDVNPVQYRLVRRWAGDGRNLFVIGDPDQAIYGFRGADRRLFRQLKQDYPAARVFHLTTNYRSTPTILRAAAAVLAGGAGEEDGPEMQGAPVATRDDGPRLVHLTVPGELAEGIAVVREVGRLVGGATMLAADGTGEVAARAWSFGDIAVLFRTGRQGELLEECFLKEGIPYRVLGRESFLEDEEVREVLAFLRCVSDPEDDFHLQCCLAGGRFALSPGGLAILRETSGAVGGIRPALTALANGDDRLDTGDAARLQAFLQALAAYRELAATAPPAELLARWLAELGGEEPEALRRLARLAGRFRDVTSFLRGLVLAQEGDYERPGPQVAAEAVSLMTLHAAKGLEFPVVFITGVEDGLLPFKDREGGAAAAALAEERRLFYVGLTRARDLVVLVSAGTRRLYGRKTARAPSPFLAAIPPDCLERRAWAEERGKKPGRAGGYSQLRLF
ncbi:MAG: UvrD-helicase domain-containing protein [Clostridia bacterium]|nr:UvrD-helicase domain-containing protein [Clostridia bacterium]